MKTTQRNVPFEQLETIKRLQGYEQVMKMRFVSRKCDSKANAVIYQVTFGRRIYSFIRFSILNPYQILFFFICKSLSHSFSNAVNYFCNSVDYGLSRQSWVSRKLILRVEWATWCAISTSTWSPRSARHDLNRCGTKFWFFFVFS